MRVLQPSNGLRLSHKAREFLGSCTITAAEHLDGYHAVQLDVSGPVHDAHTAVADQCLKFIPRDLRQCLRVFDVAGGSPRPTASRGWERALQIAGQVSDAAQPPADFVKM